MYQAVTPCSSERLASKVKIFLIEIKEKGLKFGKCEIKKNHSANVYQTLLWYYVMGKATLIADQRKKKPSEPNPTTTLWVI